MKKITVILLIIISSITLLLNCPNPDNGSNDNGPDDEEQIENKPEPPGNIKAFFLNPDFKKEITVQWDSVENVDYYKVYKNINRNEYILVEDSLTSLTSVTFLETIHSQEITYTVQSYDGAAASDMSGGSNPIILTFEDLMVAARPSAESFITNGSDESGIQISWKADINADGYVLFKSNDPDGEYEELYRSETPVPYFDTSVIPGEFYYYRLCYVLEDQFYGVSEYVFGIASNNNIDIFENNETKEKSQKLVSGSVNKANIYYYLDNHNNRLIDTDWYYITIPPGSTEIITFILAPGSPLIGTLRYKREDHDPVLLTWEDESYELTNYSDEDMDVYFTLDIDTSLITNIFEEYEIILGSDYQFF
ncbi:MAG: hypothetical protein JXJ04_23465 [Spirochaetales bacterium]|nr:hypothetical protein [Spirochaetales bacterium]